MNRAWITVAVAGLTIGCGSPAPRPPEPRRAAPPAEPPLASCSVSVETEGPAREATATAATHAEACRLAAARAREAAGPSTLTSRRRVVRVDEVSIGWLQTSTEDGLYSQGAETDFGCELTVVIPEGEPTTATGRASTYDAALEAARRDACAARPEPECPEDRYRVRAVFSRVEFRTEDGEMAERHAVTVELLPARTRSGEATAGSRPAACRRAWRAACDGDCPQGARLLELDGVTLP